MSSIPPHLKELLKNLEFLAMIEKGKKPCLNDMTFVDASSWSGALKRSRDAESKKHFLNFVDSVIEKTFIAIKDSDNKEYIPMMIETLSRARVGINNTQETYQEYPCFITSTRVFLNNIEHQLKRLQYGDKVDSEVTDLDKKFK